MLTRLWPADTVPHHEAFFFVGVFWLSARAVAGMLCSLACTRKI